MDNSYVQGEAYWFLVVDKSHSSYKSLNSFTVFLSTGRIFAGAAAIELKDVLSVLKKASTFSEITLSCLVGNDCE